jgi:8-oxo-dGTP pyrophosphatase MutT (NUDIX family)
MKSEADIIKYAALIFNEKNEVLFVRKYNKSIWINVGGRVEEGETPVECLQRELMEELNSRILTNPLPTKLLETPVTPALDDPNKTVKIIWYKITLLDNPVASSEVEEIKWINPANPSVELSPQIKEYLLPFLAGKTNQPNKL